MSGFVAELKEIWRVEVELWNLSLTNMKGIERFPHSDLLVTAVDDLLGAALLGAEHRQAVDRIAEIEIEKSRDRRDDVDRLDVALADLGDGLAGQFDKQGYMRDVGEIRLGQRSSPIPPPEARPVVRGNEHQALVEEIQPLQLVEDATEHPVGVLGLDEMALL